MTAKHILVFFFVGLTAVLCQSQADVENALNSLPPELQGKVSQDQLNEIQNKTTKIFKEKCSKNGGPDAYTNAETSIKDLMTCLNSLVDTAVLQQEIEEAKGHGAVDEVFKGYCAKKEQFKSCFQKTTDAVKPCFTDKEIKNLNYVYNATENLAGFVCYKDGDRIALFIAEGGPPCIESKQGMIVDCLNSTFGTEAASAMDDSFDINSISELAFGVTECDKFTLLQKCVVAALETCPQQTSANIVDSLFKFVRKSTPCNDLDMQPKNAPASASVASMAAATLVTALIATYIA